MHRGYNLSMTIEIDFLHNLDGIENFYTSMVQDVAGPAVKRSINRTLTNARKESLKLIHKRIKLNTRQKTKKDFSKQHVFVKKAVGLNAFDSTGSIEFSGKPMSLINFKIGAKGVPKQKGIKISKRKKVKAEIYRGKKFTLKKAFIARGKSNNIQMFKGKDGGGWIKQGIPSLAHIMKKEAMDQVIRKMIENKFHSTLTREIDFRLKKAAAKASGRPMKKVR